MLNKILIVEDEPALRNLLKTCLVKEGYQVLEAKDGQEALDIFYGENISLVILDIMLPKLDGFEVLRTLRLESDVPVLILTARNTEYDELQGLRLGADDYITKPFSPAVLVSRVKAVLKRAGIFADNDITAGSLSPTFVPDRPVCLSVKLPSAFILYARFPSVLRQPSNASVTLLEATAPVKLPA
jgi:two-component system response regulator ResD